MRAVISQEFASPRLDSEDDIVRSIVTGVGVDPLGTAGFRARVSVVPLGASTAQRFESTAHRADRTRDLVRRFPNEDVIIPFVLRGSLVGRQDGRTVVTRPGTAMLLRMDAPWSYAANDDTVLLVLRVSREMIGPRSRNLLRRVTASSLRGIAVERALVATASAALERPPHVGGPEARAIERSIALLLDAAILANVDEAAGPDDVDDVLRERARLIVEERFRDPSLDSVGVANELGVGLRRLQRLFAAVDTGIAEHIRNTRLDAIAARLRQDEPLASLAELVTDNGFAGLPQAGRAFKLRFGETMRDYRTLHGV